MPEHHTVVLESSLSPIPDESLLRTPSAIEGEGGAITEVQSRERGRMLQVRDQMAQLAAENGLKVSPAIAKSMANLPTPLASDAYNSDLVSSQHLEGSMHSVSLAQLVNRPDLLPTPLTRDYKDGNKESLRDGNVSTDTVARAIFNSGEVTEISWGKFGPAIDRWERILGRKAPAPTKPDGKDGAHRLSSAFTEWMMGLPEGWVTDVGLSRVDELKACGNGVVPQQAALALRILLEGVDLGGETNQGTVTK